MQISPEGDDRRKVSYYANGNIQLSLEGDDHRKISLISWAVNETGNMICQSNVAMQLGTSYCYLRHVFSSVLIGKRYCIILYFQISCCIGRFMFTNFLSSSVSLLHHWFRIFGRSCQVFQGRDKRRVKSVTGFTDRKSVV